MYNEFIDHILREEPFAFSRFGDGEFAAVLKREGSNCDQHTYFPDMGKALKAILEEQKGKKPDYYIGVQNHAKRQFTGNAVFEELIKFEHISSDAFHKANIKEGNLNRFFDSLKGKDVVIVGPAHLKPLRQIKFAQIEVPSRNCWLKYENILMQCEKNLRKKRVFLFCASMMSNVLIDKLWKQNKECTYIDIGSALDPYVGKNSRSYHKNMKV